MRRLHVYIEINGNDTYVGDIVGNDVSDAKFTYVDSYINRHDSSPISISLPLQTNGFDPYTTRNFFEGLLPEGFTRRCVADWMHVEESDYLSILLGLGQECLGAVRIIDSDAIPLKADYKMLSTEDVQRLAREGASESAELVTKSHLSLTGASGKVGLYFDGSNWFLPIGDAPSTHIVKQSHVRLRRIVSNEQLCLLTAKKLGIEVPNSFIINLGNYEDENVLLATERYDRKLNSTKVINGLTVPFRLHQEDFALALGISSANKYEKNNAGYMRRIFEVIRNYSSNPIEDQIRLWDICIFNYLIGNTDNHIKNISLIYNESLSSVRLAPAYDIVSTLIYESSSDEMAMSIGGIYKINAITRSSFELEAHNIGLGPAMAMRRFDEMLSKFSMSLKCAADELETLGLLDVQEISEQILKKRSHIL